LEPSRAGASCAASRRAVSALYCTTPAPGGSQCREAARIAFLLAAAERDEASFPHSLADLYRTAELAESIAYLRGLPLFPAPS
jgi:hypothetical protein